MNYKRKETVYNRPKDIPDLKKVLMEYVKNSAYDKGFYHANIINAWSEVVGERLASFSRAYKYSDRILFIKVDSSVWKNEFVYLEKDIIKRYNERFKSDIIIKIVIT